mgnify:CR=1 FL=1
MDFENLAAAMGELDEDTVKELLEAVHTGVESFVGKAPQFDDLTMLALKRS